MKLFEYQAKEVFSEAGIPVPRGKLAQSPDEAAAAAAELGCPCMIKSQLLRGGRGKLGLVKRANSPAEAKTLTEAFFRTEYGVKKVLVEQCASIAEEIYLSISIDAVTAQALILLCTSGGMDIEEISRKNPEQILRGYVSLEQGIDADSMQAFLDQTQYPAPVREQLTNLIQKLYTVFCQYDAELAEINPVFLTTDGTLVAGDGKLIIDDNSRFRQTRFPQEEGSYATPMEYEAAQEGMPYIQFDGDISLMCAGAGLTTTVYDLIHYEGGTVANYLEFGGPNYTKAEAAMRICLENRSSVILIVTFGTIARADVIAEGVVQACKKLHPDRPLVACIRGTNEEKATQLLQDAGIECLMDTEVAVRRAVAYAKEAKKA